MTEKQLAVMRGGPYDGDLRHVLPHEDRLLYERNDEFGRLGGVYDRTSDPADTPGGPAIVFEFVGGDLPPAQ